MPRGGQVIEKCLFCGNDFQHKKSVPRKFCSHNCYSEHNKGINHFNWNNDATFLNHELRSRKEYKVWRNAVYKKDRWTCQVCKKHCGKDIIAHHIKTWAEYPKLRYDVNNGMVVCKSCHFKIHHK